MTRVALVVPAFPKRSESFILSKFLGLLDRGWDVHVVCREAGSLGDLKPVHRPRVHVSWPHRPRPLAGALMPAAALRCLQAAPASTLRYLSRGVTTRGINALRELYLDASLVRLEPGIVHFEFGALAPQRMYLRDLLGCRVAVSFRGYDLEYHGGDDTYREVWERADALHMLGDHLWKRARARGCPQDKPHTCIPPALDPEFFQPGGERPGARAGTAGRPLRVLSVGRLSWVKGYEFALSAIALARSEGLVCSHRIVGEGEASAAVAFARHQLDLGDVVELRGSASPREVRGQLAWADVLLHAAVSEGFCNAVLEAQAMQVPVVCTDAGGLVENVVDGETGFIVPRRDPKALAEKLAVLAADPQLRARMGRAGRRRVLARFRIDQQLDRWEAFYRGMRPV